jgi:hypothetical protein
MKYLLGLLLVVSVSQAQEKHKEIRSKADWCALTKEEKVKHTDSPFKCELPKCDCNNQCDTEPETCDFNEKPEGIK